MNSRHVGCVNPRILSIEVDTPPSSVRVLARNVILLPCYRVTDHRIVGAGDHPEHSCFVMRCEYTAGRALVSPWGATRVGVEVGRGRVAVDVGRRRVGVLVGLEVPSSASSALTLVSNALTVSLSALLLDSAVTLRASVVTRFDRLSSVSVDCACNCEALSTNTITTAIPIPTALRLNIAVPPW